MTATDSTTGVDPVDATTFTMCMEQLQEGYVASVAATAGCLVNPVRRDLYGIDLDIIKQYGSSTEELTIKVQLKNTTIVKPDISREFFSFQFKKRKNLEQLAMARTTAKAILIVMVTNPRQMAWTVGGHEFLQTSHCCYWASLEGHAVDPDVASPSVRVPTRNRFDAPALLAMFDRLERGGAI